MIVLDQGQLAELVEAYREFDSFAFDVETVGEHRLDPRRNQVMWISMAGPGRADVIPMRHPLGDVIGYEPARTPKGRISQAANATPVPISGPPPKQLWPGDVFAALEPLFFSKRRKIGHNVKFDLQSVAKYFDGRIPDPAYADTAVACHLLNENHIGYKPYGLESCAKREIDAHWEKSFGIEIEKVPFTYAARYSYFDAKYTWLTWKEVRCQLEAEGLWDLFEMEMDVLEVVCHMETAGVYIDTAAIKKVDEDLTDEIEETYQTIRDAAGFDINLNKDEDVRNLVYGVRKHKPKMWTEKQRLPSTSAKALEIYVEKDPIVAAVVHWSELHKLHATFVKGIRSRLVDGKIHCEFDQRAAKTGRFGSREPNLQNIPVRKSKVIRDMFYAPSGYKMLVGDYSQIELRLLAHFCRDPLLLKAYTEGLDLHSITAQRAYKTQTPTEKQRSLAKNVNFSMVYGGGANTIMERYEVPLREAENLITTFYATYRHVKPWQQAVIKECKKNRVSKDYGEWTGQKPSPPYVTTLLGRKRRLPEIFYADDKARRLAERQAINTVIQGSAADLNKLAMINVYRAFKDHPTWALILTVHDELVALVPEVEAEEAALIMQDRMENLPLSTPLRVPLKVDIKICDRWSEK